MLYGLSPTLISLVLCGAMMGTGPCLTAEQKERPSSEKQHSKEKGHSSHAAFTPPEQDHQHNKPHSPIKEREKDPGKKPEEIPLISLLHPLDLSIEGKADLYKDHRFKTSAPLVAIGDLHGDLSAAVKTLKMAGALNAACDGLNLKECRWINPNLVVVQVGDTIDRGDEDKEVLDLIFDLQQKSMGNFVVLLGNHELMNAAMDMRYVVLKSFESFTISQTDAEYQLYQNSYTSPFQPTLSIWEKSVQEAAKKAICPVKSKSSSSHVENLLDKNCTLFLGRSISFKPGIGTYAKKLAQTRQLFVIINNTLFVHAGVQNGNVEKLPWWEKQIKEWLLTGEFEDPTDPDMVSRNTDIISRPYYVWSRTYEDLLSLNTCQDLSKALLALQVNHMVIGHNPQTAGINTVCDKKVWRIDVGLSKAYKGPTLQVLQIKPDASTHIFTESR